MHVRRKVLVCFSALYVITWIGGYYSHSASLKRQTQILYDNAKKADAEKAAFAAKEGTAPPRAQAYEDGPRSVVNWCFPVFPGVLVADSAYRVGPLYGRGGFKIVIFYGFGSWAIGPFWGWIS